MTAVRDGVAATGGGGSWLGLGGSCPTSPIASRPGGPFTLIYDATEILRPKIPLVIPYASSPVPDAVAPVTLQTRMLRGVGV